MEHADYESLSWSFDNDEKSHNNELERQEVTEQMFTISGNDDLSPLTIITSATSIDFQEMIADLDVEQLLAKMAEAHKQYV